LKNKERVIAWDAKRDRFLHRSQNVRLPASVGLGIGSGTYAGRTALARERRKMAEKFNPAPPDILAEDPKQGQKADKNTRDKLEKGLEGTFPASDPPSSTEPRKAKPDA
jgi:hypothetical protein